MTMMNTVSILDVAASAGVSVATASRVLSKSSYPVSDGTRQKVLEAATRLNYTPNALARSMKTRRSNLIAILVGDNADAYFAEIMNGVEEVASSHGFLTIVCNTNRDPEKEINYLHTLRDYRADGIIFASSGLSVPGYAERLEVLARTLKEQGTALVTLSQHTLQLPSVHADNFGGAFAMTSRLIEMGHRKIAFVTGPANLAVANVRLHGYMAALSKAGIVVNPNFLLTGDFSMAGGQQAVQGLLNLPARERPTAIFGANDETAIGILGGLRRLGLQIPEDISVCGFGDLPVAQLVFPSLTTVRIDLRELGRKGVFNLLGQLEQEEEPGLEVLPTTIIERDSTTVPKHN
ncbi:MAG TPA: LacI family DNA-binding transcriptional regulator [Chloroflexia bacterium]|nr:LacI family DNA-binding transcriptional regulator [Chloroflexia bacterium]